MPSITQNLPAILDALGPVFVAVLMYVSLRVSTFINEKVKNERLKAALLKLDEVVTTTVKDVQQTTVDALKAAAADGTITEEEQRDVKSKAMHAAIVRLGDLKALGATLGMTPDAVHNFVLSKIEATVYDLRKGAL